jgi:uncharacterized phage protein gp47/JayE
MVIPTVQQLQAQYIARLESELNITIPTFGKSFLRALSTVQAGIIWILFMAIAQVQKNIFVDTCDVETLGRFGQVKLGRDRFPATQGQYQALVTGEIGAVIPAGTTFRANDDSFSPTKRFILDNEFILDGTNLITIRALEAGNESRLQILNQLTAESPIALVNSIITVQSELIQPQSAETVENYRNAIIQAFRLEPQGGSPADYRLWSLEVQGIINAFPFASVGQTSRINLYLEADDNDGIPTLTDLNNVRDNIELPTATRPSRKPVTAIVNYLPVVPKEIDIEIADFQDLDSDIETLIFSALESKLNAIRPFVGAIDILANKNDYFDVNSIISIILEARPGSVFGNITFTIDGFAFSQYTFENGNIPKLNTVSYV